MSVLANNRIDFSRQHLTKPANLANSAVLRMLEEEEERQRSGKAGGVKRVTWPPPPETDFLIERGEEPVYIQPNEPQYQSPPPVAFAPAPVHPQQQLNINISHSPQLLQQQQSPSWAPVHSPVLTPSNESSYQCVSQVRSYQPHSFRSVPTPPPGFVTLRTEAPVTQKPPPVISSQPATASFQGGSNMRGDQKWPPPTVKAQSEAENEARVLLAKGPACRPRKVKKDYSKFFAQHALTSTYPGYRAPPGTQHYIEEGTSNL